MSFFQKTYVALIGFLVINILVAVLVIYPLFKNIQKESEELLFQKNSLVFLAEEIRNLEASKNFYNIHQENIERIDGLFVDSKAPIGFINFLEKTAASSQLSVDISLTAIMNTKPKEDFWPSLSFQVSATGSFISFLAFLEKIENSPYLIELLSLNLRRVDEARAEKIPLSSDVNATLLLKVFAK